jgi:hypothetical protein
MSFGLNFPRIELLYGEREREREREKERERELDVFVQNFL